jgi:hypothetical protein
MPSRNDDNVITRRMLLAGSAVLGAPVLGSAVLGSAVLGAAVLDAAVLGAAVLGCSSRRHDAAWLFTKTGSSKNWLKVTMT